MNYHIGRLVLSSLCVGAFVAVGIWWFSFCRLQPGTPTTPTLPFLQHTPLLPSTRAMVVCYCVISVTSHHLVTEITQSRTAVALAAILRHYRAVRPMIVCMLVLKGVDIKHE